MVSERLMKVEYVGKSDFVTTEYNGKRYCFSRKNKLKIIPATVFLSIQSSGAVFAPDIMPYTSPELQKEYEDELSGKTDLSEDNEEESEDLPDKKMVNDKPGRRPGRPKRK